MQFDSLKTCLGMTVLALTLWLTSGRASAQVSQQEATTACETVISQKPGLANFQYSDTKADHALGSWKISGRLSSGSDVRRYMCKVDDRGRVAVATVAAITPDPTETSPKKAK